VVPDPPEKLNPVLDGVNEGAKPALPLFPNGGKEALCELCRLLDMFG